MGEAKRRAIRLKEWHDSLTDDEKIVVEVASQTFDRFVQPDQAVGMCYRLAFFLTELLEKEYSVTVEPVVGWVNDGTGFIMTSHAWIETGSKRTDISLGFTEHPNIQLPGEVLILDRIVKSGTRYSYHRQQTPESLQVLNQLRADPRYSQMVKQKDVEHAEMLERSGNSISRRSYLDSAPDGFNYSRLSSIVTGRVTHP